MSADKRALDELDALFRAVPTKAVNTPRPVKKPRSEEADVVSLSGDDKRGTNARKEHEYAAKHKPTSSSSSAVVATESVNEEKALYSRLPTTLLPKGFRSGRSSRASGSSRSSITTTTSSTSIGASAAIRLADLVRGILGATANHRAVEAAIESRLEHKVLYLQNSSVKWQTEGQTAGARAGAGRAAINASRHGLSGKKCKKMGLNALQARGGGRLSFRDLLGLHDIWKGYATRLVSLCGRNQKLLQQRILSADLQGCYLTVSRSSVSSLVNVAGILVRETPKTLQVVTPQGKTKTIPKRSSAVCLAFGGMEVNLDGKALEGRSATGSGGGGAGIGMGGQQTGRGWNSSVAEGGVSASDTSGSLVSTTAL